MAPGLSRPIAGARTPRRVRVLVLGTNPARAGGISSVVRMAMRSRLRDTYDLRLIATRGEDGDEETRWQRLARAIRWFASVAWVALSWRPRLAHVHTASYSSYYANSLPIALFRLLLIPCVVHVHGGYFDRFLGSLKGLRKRWVGWTLRGASRVIALSPHWAEILGHHVDAARVRVVTNATDAAVVTDREFAAGPVTVLTVGRVGDLKGTDVLLDAAAALASDPDPDVAATRVVIVGPGESEAEWDEAVERVRVTPLPTVELTGKVQGSALGDVYRRADVFVLPSRVEALPMAVLEAMAAALPVVATPVGAIPEVIGADQGILVPAGDPQALADALKRLARDPGLRRSMGEANRAAFAERFGPDRFARDVDAIYRDVLGRGKPPAGRSRSAH